MKRKTIFQPHVDFEGGLKLQSARSETQPKENVKQMKQTPRSDAVQHYLDRGFEEICTDSGKGSRILINKALCRAVKLNEDRAYHEFVEFARNNYSERFPEIFLHSLHKQEDQFPKYWFTLTEMEYLDPLSQKEAEQLITWYNKAVVGNRTSGKEDPFNLWPTLQSLKELAVSKGYNLDMGKATNYMIRNQQGKRVVVVIDPFD